MNESMYSMLMLVVVFAIMYFLLIRPENKRKKEQDEMRNNISLGDEIVTIGGIIGKVVQVTEETVTFETGEDRVRIQVKKWAIQTNERAEAKAKEAAEAKKNAKKEKNYALADAIRAELAEKGVTLIDTPEGTKFKIGE